jgi:hypothetical protein
VSFDDRRSIRDALDAVCKALGVPPERSFVLSRHFDIEAVWPPS